MRTGIVLTVAGLFIVSLMGWALAQGTQAETPTPPGQQMPMMPGMQGMMPAMQQMMQACVQMMGQMAAMMGPAPQAQPPKAQ